MLPTTDFCGLNVTRLVIGANPFGGFSHQTPERNREMVDYYTVDRIIETWGRAEAAGINTMVTNNRTPHVLEAVRAYLGGGGKLQWIAQLNRGDNPDMAKAVAEAAEIGCCGVYFHGAQVEELYEQNDADAFAGWCADARRAGVVVGAAAHCPAVHDWVNGLDLVDFHAVAFFNCGSLHTGAGHKFQLADVGPATECIRRIAKPCIGYKIMGAGRIDAAMALQYAFASIKPIDVVNVGMHRGDRDDMVEEDAQIVRSILA